MSFVLTLNDTVHRFVFFYRNLVCGMKLSVHNMNTLYDVNTGKTEFKMAASSKAMARVIAV